MSDQNERRKSPRLDATLDVEMEIDGVPMKATTTNISCGGLFLKMDPSNLQPPSLGDVNLVIYLPNRHKPVELAAHILRRETAQRPGVAVEFENPDQEMIDAIEQWIRSKLH